MLNHEIILMNKLLKKYRLEYLVCEQLYNKSYTDAEAILDLKAWENPDFKPLLTSTIWSSSLYHINEVLTMSYWGNPIYKKLLTSTIWSISVKRIKDAIEIFEKLGLESYITTNCLRKSPMQIQALYQYLIDNNLNIIVDDKLNPIFSVAPSILQKRYGINIKTLTETQKRKIKL